MTGERKSFIDRENDAETGNYNLGVRSEEDEEGRFLSVDPLWEKYPGLSPYNYCANNPMTFTDRSGDSINFAGNLRLRSQFLVALDYLERHGVEGACYLRELYDSKTIWVHMRSIDNASDDQFQMKGYETQEPTLYWAPLSGLKYQVNVEGRQETEIVSPAVNLLHEGDHAFHDLVDYKGSPPYKVSDPDYGYYEERRVVQGSEGPAALKLGEVKTIRQHSDGSGVNVGSPISNVPIRAVQPHAGRGRKSR